MLDATNIADNNGDNSTVGNIASNRPYRKYMSVATTAVYMDVSTTTIRRLGKSGKLTELYPVPGRICFEVGGVDRYMDASVKQPPRGRGRGKKKKEGGEPVIAASNGHKEA